MAREKGSDPSKQVIDVVLELLISDGYDAVQLREVARRARVSLTTVYKLFPTRDELIVAAVEHWMTANTYGDMTPPAIDSTLREGLMGVFRTVFEPWQREPRMLVAYHHARTGPGGHRLDLQGVSAVIPILNTILGGADPTYLADVAMVLTNVTYALIARVADASLEITEILPTIERAVFRLTSDNEAEAEAARNPSRSGNTAINPSLAAPFDHS
ncbi:TetR family transcriptional regulator [Nocardia sp. NBC_01388]|uniref:TetR family transcriptional regulator n=1 Tax=Nocardia sp. NBC_01388 TaxID=2903596 RepID=UPI003248D7E2